MADTAIKILDRYTLQHIKYVLFTKPLYTEYHVE
jgi:hypothetical protein